MSGEVLIHLPRHMVGALADNPDTFYRKLEAGLRERGARARIVARAVFNERPDPDDGNFHFVHQIALRQDNVLCTGLAYVFPFWYADRQGIYGDSSLTEADFDPARVPSETAAAFHRRTFRRLAGARFSRYEQKREVTDIPPGAVAVFLQGRSDILDRVRHVTTLEMLRAVLDGAGDRTVVIKPHPRGETQEVVEFLHAAALNDGRVRIVDANIHDILSRAAVSVSVASAVALEGMLHRTPAILFGRSDLHHCAVTLTAPAGFAAALDRAMRMDWPFAQFLYWFLAQNMLNTGSGDFIGRAIARIAANGVDPGSLGLR